MLAFHAIVHLDDTSILLAEEVPDLDGAPAIAHIDVDGKVSVDGSHPVLVTLRNERPSLYDHVHVSNYRIKILAHRTNLRIVLP